MKDLPSASLERQPKNRHNCATDAATSTTAVSQPVGSNTHSSEPTAVNPGASRSTRVMPQA